MNVGMGKEQSMIYTERLKEIITNKVKVSDTLGGDDLLWSSYVRQINGTENKLDICKRSNFGRENSSVGLTVPYTRFCTLPDNKIPCKARS